MNCRRHPRSDRLSCISLATIKDGVLTIGNVSAPVYNPDMKMKVPDVLFYDNPQVITHTDSHMSVLTTSVTAWQPFTNPCVIIKKKKGQKRRLFLGHDPNLIT